MDKKTLPKDSYIEAIGRRKTAVARVRIEPASKTSLSVNGKDVESYFKTRELRTVAFAPITKNELPASFKISAKIVGGGASGQAEALRHGISRALIAYDLSLRPAIKKLGFLKRDPRMKERRKFGLKKARKAAQWSKR